MSDIQLPLSQTGDPVEFATAVEAHRAAVAAHRVGRSGEPAPAASPMIEALIVAVPDTGPVAARRPDTIAVLPYEIVDDTPKTPEAEQAISVLRETILGT